MKLAVMQPYFFPYLGYFQLIHSVDMFVFYDDVSFIKGGWVNRNFLKDKVLFTIPILNQSSFVNIKDTKVDWSSNRPRKFVKTLEMLYRDSPDQANIVSIVKSVLDEKPETISELSISSIKAICKYLDIRTQFKTYSQEDYNRGDRVENLINICKKEGADIYINPINGQDLYSKERFQEDGITLKFIKSNGRYSILDDIMYKEYDLNNYELI